MISRNFASLFLIFACDFLNYSHAFQPIFFGSSFRKLGVTAESHCDNQEDIRIRNALYGDLGTASEIIYKSFYANSGFGMGHMYRLAELNRLQQNFPREPSLHRMLVAVPATQPDTIVAFCDIDARIPNQPKFKHNPRPYLSDLAVDPEWRRRGIARSMIRACEEFSLSVLHRDDLYIRVLKNNDVAIKMYESLGYAIISSPEDPEEVFLLHRKLE